ncbi:MAG: phosphoenolpyruvate carboxykinase (ATP) [Bacteroidota bacterium]
MSVPTMFAINRNSLLNSGLKFSENIHYQLGPEELTDQSLDRNEGVLSDTGALVINTGEFTGRSPKDKFIVQDPMTKDTVFWSEFNIPIEEHYFLQLKQKMLAYLNDKEIWIRDCYACADKNYRLHLRVINETPSANLFAYNMFIRPEEDDLEKFSPHWHIIQAPNFKADPKVDGTRSENFAILSFTHKTILIGGTGYTGEIKKGIFTMLNYVLPLRANVLSMHCSANIGRSGDTAVFFGLSGTGKTTLSADPNRKLIGDDEHGWTDNNVFNFEGGCYAKTIDLCEANEPEIYNAIRSGALVENVQFFDDSNTIDFSCKKITENTRVSYPLHFISNAIEPSIGNIPKNIFFLTCDAYGVLPPISKLTPGQAMYQFISGYTAKVAGTEAGIIEPKSTFSACFGAPFLPLHPTFYAKLLGEKLKEQNVNIWLVNTGWTGGPYGIGKRMKLSNTRAMITAALDGSLNNVEYDKTHWFKLSIPKTCPNVDAKILNPKNTWPNPEEFDKHAKKLADQFNKNFEKYAGSATEEILAAAHPEPK